jgi:osmoprotectant transport system permease protein
VPRLIVHQRVLAVLVLAGLAAAFGLAFLTQAPNRLVTGTGIRLSELLAGPQLALLLPAALLAVGVFQPPSRRLQALLLLCALVLLVGCVALAGHQASRSVAASGCCAR